MNALRTKRVTIVTADVMRRLVEIKSSFDAARGTCEGQEEGRESSGRGNEVPTDLALFDTSFRLGENPGYHYDMDPVDPGYGLRLTQSGIPRLASSDVGRGILERLQRISRPYGTSIAIERDVGVIRLPDTPRSGSQPADPGDVR